MKTLGVIPWRFYRTGREALHDVKRKFDVLGARRRLLAAPDMSAADKDLLKQISLEIGTSDDMYRPGCAIDYLTAGLSASRCLRAILEKSSARKAPQSILDLPSGHGRVLRFLRVLFPELDITAGETQTEALSFCERTFSVRAFQSGTDFDALSLFREFDLIWCGSLITHLDERAATKLLRFFYRHLSAEGICVFTAHGKTAVELLKTKQVTYALTDPAQEQVLRDYEATGYGYADYAGSPGYGVSVSSHARVVQLASAIGQWGLVHYLESGWHGVQDVYAFAKVRNNAEPGPSTVGV